MSCLVMGQISNIWLFALFVGILQPLAIELLLMDSLFEVFSPNN